MTGQIQKQIIRVVTPVVLILSVPFLAMQFSSEVNWTGFDFLVMALLLLTTGIAIEIVAKRFQNTSYRYLAIGGVLLLAVLLWIEMAVGIFD